ncbi:hypothetical protein RBJ15_11450 [Pantoea sp. BS_4]|uniref:hypothetical protein n=1 Tax=unclassified Pantoea TaxID=2630326 RepID=UPI0035BF3321
MKSHEFTAPENGSKGQQRCGPERFMQVHENRYMKRAGVAGLRERAAGLNGVNRAILVEPVKFGREKSRRFGEL